MELNKKQRTIKYSVFAVIIALSALIQNVGGLSLEIGGARCFFIIPTAVILGIGEDERVAAVIGMLAGVLWDVVSVQHMGFNFVFLMLTCYISSALVSYVFRCTFWVQAISSMIISLFYCIAYWLIFVLIGGSDGAGMSLLYFYIPCAIYTSIVTLFLCSIYIPVKRRLNHESKEDGVL